MGNIDGSSRSEHGESPGLLNASGLFGDELDLEVETENVSTQG